jgi:hypothetical protein
MKKFAAASLALALGMSSQARAQSPFFQTPVEPVQPAAAMQLAPAMPPGGVVPVRVYFGGALTQNGVVPVPVYTNQPVGALPAQLPAATYVAPAQGSDGGGFQRIGTAPGAAKTAKASAVFTNDDGVAPAVCDPRFLPPDANDMRPSCAPVGYRWYAAAEFLQWRVKGQESPPLLTIDGTPVSAADVDAHTRQGARFTVGHWLDIPECHPWAIEGSFMFLGMRRASNIFASNGVATLAHPFIDADTGAPDSLPVAIAGSAAADPRVGGTSIEAASQLWSGEVNLRREIWRNCHGHFDFLFGYRQLQLDESLTVRDLVMYDVSASPLSGATVGGIDFFGTHNRLFTGQVGLEAELNWRGLFIDAWGKFAMGGLQEVVNINGGTTIVSTPGLPPVPGNLVGQSAGSLYAQPSNIGHYERERFSILPEVGVTVGYQITSNVRIGAGYNFLYLNNVVRPGDAIDTTITRTQIPQLQPGATVPGTRPAPPTFVETSYWAHGITAMLEFRY